MKKTENNHCNFTFSHYENVFKNALSKGYVISKLEDYEKNIKNKKIIFLRHDVDFNLILALRLAKLEHKIGIKSTFFLRIHGDYNLFSYNNYSALNQIISMGHEIALHHECGFANLFGNKEEKMINDEKKLLETITGLRIRGISLHEPARTRYKLGKEIIKNLGFSYDAYSSKFIKDIKYISDSSARWREGCMCNFIEAGVPKLCILTHPFWWYEKTPLENY